MLRRIFNYQDRVIHPTYQNEQSYLNKLLLKAASSKFGKIKAVLDSSGLKEYSIRDLIAKGADVNFKEEFTNKTALMNAALNSSLNIMKSLLDAGADVNIQNNYGETALMIFVKNFKNPTSPSSSEIKIAKAFLNYGTDVDIADNMGKTVLMLVGELSLAKKIIERSKNINQLNEDGDTALIHASYHGSDAIVKHLIKNGADVDIKGDGGLTAEENAVNRSGDPKENVRYTNIVKMLKKASNNNVDVDNTTKPNKSFTLRRSARVFPEGYVQNNSSSNPLSSLCKNISGNFTRS